MEKPPALLINFDVRLVMFVMFHPQVCETWCVGFLPSLLYYPIYYSISLQNLGILESPNLHDHPQPTPSPHRLTFVCSQESWWIVHHLCACERYGRATQHGSAQECAVCVCVGCTIEPGSLGVVNGMGFTPCWVMSTT